MADFEYFRAEESDQFSFFRIPKALFTEKEFASLSTDAKLLYGILLDGNGTPLIFANLIFCNQALFSKSVDDAEGSSGGRNVTGNANFPYRGRIAVFGNILFNEFKNYLVTINTAPHKSYLLSFILSYIFQKIKRMFKLFYLFFNKI